MTRTTSSSATRVKIKKPLMTTVTQTQNKNQNRKNRVLKKEIEKITRRSSPKFLISSTMKTFTKMLKLLNRSYQNLSFQASRPSSTLKGIRWLSKRKLGKVKMFSVFLKKIKNKELIKISRGYLIRW